MNCPLTATVTVIGGKWNLIIIYWLNKSSKNFGSLKRLIPDLSSKVLSAKLRELVAAGIVQRRSTGKIPSPVFYQLTAYGKTIIPIIDLAVS